MFIYILLPKWSTKIREVGVTGANLSWKGSWVTFITRAGQHSNLRRNSTHSFFQLSKSLNSFWIGIFWHCRVQLSRIVLNISQGEVQGTKHSGAPGLFQVAEISTFSLPSVLDPSGDPDALNFWGKTPQNYGMAGHLLVCRVPCYQHWSRTQKLDLNFPSCTCLRKRCKASPIFLQGMILKEHGLF